MLILKCENYFTTVPQVVGTNENDYEKIYRPSKFHFSVLRGYCLCCYCLFNNRYATI